MPRVRVNGVDLHVEERGSGPPIVFAHEFGGDWRSWEGQMAHFAARHRCVAYNARGYPPSEVPDDEAAYGYEIAVDDLRGVMDALDIPAAFVVGLSMGAYTGLVFAQRHPDRLRGLVAASGGSGAYPPAREGFVRDCRALADAFLASGSMDVHGFAEGATRVQLANKDREAFDVFARYFREHSPVGSAYTMRRVQAARPSLYDLEDALGGVETPTLLIVGDEDDPCLDVNLFLKRVMPRAGLAVLAKSGHLVNLEEPAAFNGLIEAFVADVEAGSWRARDPRARTPAAYLTRAPSRGA